MRRVSTGAWVVALAVLTVVGCKAKPAGGELAQSYGDAPVAKAGIARPAQPAPAAAPMLAYDYSYDLETPSDRVRPLLTRHEQACVAAGPATCQVLAADVQTDRDQTSGTLKLRAAEAWLASFRNGLETDATTAGGKVLRSGVQSEDLTRSIVDTGAAVRAKTMLRDRLEQLLAQRPGKLSELLELEQNIATVQGDIDASQSELAVMQARVAMSSLTVSYESNSGAISGRTIRPLANAFGGFAANSLMVLAGMVTLLSFLLPIGLAIVLVWLGWRWIAKSRRRPPPPPATGKSQTKAG